jgi:putative phosphoribosyl transferase
MTKFRNRSEAGQKLSEKLRHLKPENPLILALPRGGIPVAAEIAKSLGAPLSLLLVKKVGVPWQPELAAGAVCEGLEPIFNKSVLAATGLTPEDLRQIVVEKRDEMDLQKEKFGLTDEDLDVRNKTVVLVDDGVATGSSLRMALVALRRLGPKKIVLAVPVGPRATLIGFQSKVDEVVSVLDPEDLLSVGFWYEDFNQVSEAEAIALFKRARGEQHPRFHTQPVAVLLDHAEVKGDLRYQDLCKAWVVFAHGSGSSHASPRNQRVAKTLTEEGYGTFLFDLLTADEEVDRRNVFDMELLSERLILAKEWLKNQDQYQGEPLVYFGASTGAAAALIAASKDPAREIATVISRGGRPDMAEDVFGKVHCPVLLIVGGKDGPVIHYNKLALKGLPHAELKLVENAGHLFEEPGTLEEVERLCLEHLRKTIPQWNGGTVGSDAHRTGADRKRGGPSAHS